MCFPMSEFALSVTGWPLAAVNQIKHVALAEAGKRSEVCEYDKIANTPTAVKTLAAKLARNGHELRFC